MFILQRYLLRQFLQIFLICFVSLIGLYIVIDLFGHLDHFSSYAEQEGNLLGVIAKYYAYHSLGFFDGVSGLLAMISAMFTVAWLSRHQELTAMMAAGLSKFRVIKPLVFAAAGVSLLGVVNREFVIPRVRDELTRDTKDLGGGAARDLEASMDESTGILVGGEQVVMGERRIINPSFILLAPELASYGKQFAAANAYYVDAAAERPAGFVLKRVTTPPHIDQMSSLAIDGRPVVVTHRDAPAWLAPGDAFIATAIDFPTLAVGSRWRTYASLPELIHEVKSPTANAGADVRVAVHARGLQFLLDGTLVMLGLPVMMSRRGRNVYLSIGMCFGIATLFLLTVLACQSLGGLTLLPPALAAWLPLMIFVPLAAGLNQSLRT